METPLTILDDSTGKILLYRDWLENSVELFNGLKSNLYWHSREIKLFGKSHPIPRLENWQSILGVDYRYSGQQYLGAGLSSEFLELINRINSDFLWLPNSALSNYYRDGNDTMGWHSDNEVELGPLPNLAILSLGESRDLAFRFVGEKTRKLKVSLNSGSLLFMSGDVQSNWQHSLPKRANKGERISCTFRRIIN
jgi:alkylated DNA repair dioxygenase AlkB